MITTQTICNTLNRLYKLDPAAAYFLINNRVLVNESIVNDESLICYSTPLDNVHTIGLLGIINGILLNDGSETFIVASFDNQNNKFLGFTITEVQ